MKTVVTLFLFAVCLICLGTFAGCHFVAQGEKAFVYDVSSGKAVNQNDNPLRPTGFCGTWGINQRFFSVLGTSMDYEFTHQKNGEKYDESLSWNSSEGVVMGVDYKLYGRVTNVWEFFLHFGEPEYNYQTEAKKDKKVYEALRQAGRVLDQYLNELAASTNAETIRTSPDWLKATLLPKVQIYMSQFGFEITDLMFINNFQYPDGNTIVEARKQLTALDSEIRSITQTCSNQQNQIKINVDQEKIIANNKIAEAKRRASAMLAESHAQAQALKQSIEQVGVDGTMRLKMAELYAELSRAGAIPNVVVTENSIFAAPFYPATRTTNSIHTAQKILPEIPISKK